MRVAVVGGTGFIGSYLVDTLLERHHVPTLLVRHGSDQKVRVTDNTARIVHGDLDDDRALVSTMFDCSAVIFNVGILREDPARGITFEDLQFHAVERCIEAAKVNGIQRFILMSANGVRLDGTPYQRSKAMAEQALKASGMDYTIFRPSIVFGDPRGLMEIGTQLLNDVVKLPIPAAGFQTGLFGGAVEMSPVHVQDVADAFVHSLSDDSTIGQTYTLGGPETLSWAELVSRVASASGTRKWIVPAPIPLVKIPVRLLQWIPNFPVTTDQLSMLADGNTATAADVERLIGRQAKSFSEDNLRYLA